MPPVKLFFCVILLAGFLRLILSGNLKIALVLGVICIGVKGFFFGLLFLFLLHKGIDAAARRQADQCQHTQKGGCILCNFVFFRLLSTG